jgi:hypothetical protein
MIQLTPYENMIVQCVGGTDRDAALLVAQNFCKAFEVRSIVVHWNDYFIQVTKHGVQIPEDLRNGKDK